MRKRILSFLLALAMLCAVLPQLTWPAHADGATSGRCGENLTWRFDQSTDTLTIEGSGAMYDFYVSTQPWHTYMASIKKVVFPDGLTTISDCAFYDCTGLTSITFPDGLVSIDSNAFSNCTGLTSITLPDGLTSIGDHAFLGCTGLKAFSIAEENSYLSVDSCGALFDKAKTKLIQYPCGRSGSYEVPKSVTSINSNAFSGCTGLTAITLPDGLTSINWQTFSGCTGLTALSLPNGITTIGAWAFSGCTGLTTITFPDGLTTIGHAAFSRCTGLTSATFPDGLVSIDSYAFLDCTGLTSITLPDGLTTIGYEAFSGCTGLTEITLPGRLTTIGSEAFCGCTGLKAFSIAEENPYFSVDSGGVLFDKAKTKLIQCPCGRRGSYEIPKSVTSIDDSAFLGCARLTSITLPDGLTSIGDHAFYGCTGLKAFSIAEENSYLSVDSCGALFDKAKTMLIQYPCGRSGSYEVPKSVTSINDSAFFGCTGLTAITLPDGLTSINWQTFSGCTGLTALSLPNGIIAIDTWAFYGCTGLTTITFPDRLTTIGYAAFSGCTGLTSVTFPDGLVSIDSYAFSNCTGLTSVSFSDGITIISNGAFHSCTGLTSVTFPDGLYAIGDAAFCGCTGLTSVTFPDGLTFICDDAFLGCTELAPFTLPDRITFIGESAFSGCNRLTSVVIPESVETIRPEAFGYYGCWEDDIFSGYPMENFTIYGYEGTAAQTYAQDYGFQFVPLDPESGFADVNPDKYYYQPMLWALNLGITSGTSQVSFGPNNTCTRGQVMTFLWKAMLTPEADWSSNPFVDVPSDKYYYKPVLWAFQNGITGGADPTHFNPKGGCTRAQVVTFLWAASGKPDPTNTGTKFEDVSPDKYYYKAVQWAAENGITGGTDSTHFSPNATCTRAQVVTFLYKLLAAA